MGQVSKLKYVDSKLGAPTGGQQTTRGVMAHNNEPRNAKRIAVF